MNIRSRKASRQFGFAASAITALGLVAAAPVQSAVAESSHAPVAFVSNGTLIVAGTDGNDTIKIGLDVDPGTLLVDVGPGRAALAFDRDTFNAIRVFLGDGDDTFAVEARGGDFVDEALTVLGGRGNDLITGGAGDDVLNGGSGDDTILGSAGTDTIFGGRGADTIDGGRGTDTEILGRGNDVAVWDPGEGNDIIAGDRGHDVLEFNGAAANENFAVSADGAHAILTRDLGSIRMDTVGVEQFALATLGGADTVSVNDLQQTEL